MQHLHTSSNLILHQKQTEKSVDLCYISTNQQIANFRARIFLLSFVIFKKLEVLEAQSDNMNQDTRMLAKLVFVYNVLFFFLLILTKNKFQALFYKKMKKQLLLFAIVKAISFRNPND